MQVEKSNSVEELAKVEKELRQPEEKVITEKVEVKPTGVTRYEKQVKLIITSCRTLIFIRTVRPGEWKKNKNFLSPNPIPSPHRHFSLVNTIRSFIPNIS